MGNSTNEQDPNAWSPTGGPLQCSWGKYVDPFGTWVQIAAQRLGFQGINGFQTGKLLGSAYGPFTIDPVKSQRSSSESSFLQSVSTHQSPLGFVGFALGLTKGPDQDKLTP